MSVFSRTHLAFIPALALALAACDKQPPAPKAVVQEATPAPAATPAALAAEAAKPASVETLSFSQDGSSLTWVGAKVTLKHDGGFKKFAGKIELADGSLEKGKVSVEIETDSIFSDAEKLTGHLKSADFFEVEKFPKAEFVSTEIKAGGEGDATHTVTGNLTMHGVTKSVSFPAKIVVADSEVAGDATFTINRKDFGIVYPGKPDDLIHDNVTIKLAIKAPRAAKKEIVEAKDNAGEAAKEQAGEAKEKAEEKK